MSDDAEQLIDLDARPADASARRDRIRDWLIASGWAGDPLPADYADLPDALMFQFGPRALRDFPTFRYASLGLTGNNGIWMTDGEPEPPQCPTCGTENEEYWEQLEEWSTTGVEPVSTCESCGFTGPVGDWVIDNTPLGGSMGISISFASSEYAGEDVARTLLAELKDGLGGRWAYTHHHL